MHNANIYVWGEMDPSGDQKLNKQKLDHPGFMKAVARVKREMELSACTAVTSLEILKEVKGGFAVTTANDGHTSSAQG